MSPAAKPLAVVSRRKGSGSTVHPCGREFRLGITATTIEDDKWDREFLSLLNEKRL
jgi:hypothetical protein